MEIKHEKLPRARVKLTIEVPWEELNVFFDRAYEKLAPTVEIQGFRPGKAPRALIEEKIGHERLAHEALDLALAETYAEAATREKIFPLAGPAINIKSFDKVSNLIYEAEVDVLPEIKLGEYKKVRVKRNEIKVTDQDVEETLKHLREQKAIFHDVERPARENDRVEIDFEGSIGGVKQDSLTSKNHPVILGRKTLVEDFEKQLIGVKQGEEKKFTIDVLSRDGKTKQRVDFIVKVHWVQEMVLPDFDQEFAKQFQAKDMTELRNLIRGDIQNHKSERENQRIEKEVVDKVSDMAKLEIPETLIENEISRQIGDLENQLVSYGQNLAGYLNSVNKSVEDLRGDLRPGAEKSVKNGLVLGEIARAEKFITPEAGKLDESKQMEAIRKTINFLVNNATQ